MERIDEYLNLNVQEPPYEIESNRPPAYWPSSTSGRPIIRVEDLEIKYAPGQSDTIPSLALYLVLPLNKPCFRPPVCHPWDFIRGTSAVQSPWNPLSD